MNSESHKRSSRKNFFVASLVALAFVFDRFFKYLAVNDYFESPLEIIGKWFRLSYAKNPNIAFSLPFNRVLLLFLTSAIIIGLLYYLLSSLKHRNYKSAIYLSAIILGAISNLADRIELQYVIDYFDLRYFTVFNVADIMIVGGVVGFLFSIKNESHKS